MWKRSPRAIAVLGGVFILVGTGLIVWEGAFHGPDWVAGIGIGLIVASAVSARSNRG
jgi:drug/metabolite transporter (DMT)-like permease